MVAHTCNRFASYIHVCVFISRTCTKYGRKMTECKDVPARACFVGVVHRRRHHSNKRDIFMKKEEHALHPPKSIQQI